MGRFRVAKSRLEFPDLCRAIGRKIAQLKKAEMNGHGERLKAALLENPPPTAGQLAGSLGFASPGVLARNFPTSYAALLARRNAYEEAQREQLRSALTCALEENPAPTVPAICGRLGISTSWVYCLYGDLARAIAARHLKERVESMDQRRKLLRIEVSAIVKDMLDRREHPVQSRVRKMLSGADSLKARRMLGHCLKGVISELQAERLR